MRLRPIHVPRAAPLLSAALVALALAPAGSATKPDRQLVPADADAVITGQCDFAVLGHIEGGEIDTTFFDNGGDAVKKLGVFPGQTLTLTNVETGKTITLVNAGSTQFRAQRDGSVELAIMGHGPVPNEVAGGQPGIWYLSGGRVFVILDPAGNPTSITVRGNVVNLCGDLEPAS